MFNRKKTLEVLADGILTLNKRVNLLEKADNYNTMYEEQADKRITELEENLRLVYEYLGVHKVVLNEAVLVDDEEEPLECCNCCEEDIDDREDWKTIYKKKK